MRITSVWIMPRLLAAAIAVVPSSQAMAQLSNKPFSFNAPGGIGVGMSIGGRQAILNEKLFDLTPKNLLRDASGQLLGVERGPGRAVIVSSPGGEFLPGFRRSFRDRSKGFGAGVFNANFVPEARSSSNAVYFFNDGSGVPVDVWTTRVLTHGGADGFSPSSPVNLWTGYVYILGPKYNPVSAGQSRAHSE